MERIVVTESTSGVGWYIGLFVLVLIIIILIVLAIIFIPRFFKSSNNGAGFPVLNSNGRDNTNIADFRPITLTKSDLKRFCNDPSSCDVSENSSESHSTSCSQRSDSSSTSSCSSCKKLPCAFKQKCRDVKAISVSGSVESCDESSGSRLWSNSCSTCNSGSDSNSETNSINCNRSDSECNSGDSMESHMNQKDFFTALDLKVICFNDLRPDQIKDITDNGSTVFALKKFNTTKIVLKKCKSKSQCEITSKLSLDRIIWFQGTIFALSGGTLYQRDPSSVGSKTWFWFTIQNVPTGITWITKTIDGKYLWIQTADKGILFNCNRKLVDTIDIKSNIQRNFGKTVNTIGDIDTNTHELLLINCNKKFSNIGAFTFNFNNEVIFIRPPQLDVVSGIRLVLFRPYYLLK